MEWRRPRAKGKQTQPCRGKKAVLRPKHNPKRNPYQAAATSNASATPALTAGGNFLSPPLKTGLGSLETGGLFVASNCSRGFEGSWVRFLPPLNKNTTLAASSTPAPVIIPK